MAIASVQKILSVEPIKNADTLDKVKVLGWQLVAKKGEFHVGDCCVYVEIDSILPEKPEFEFLRNKNFKIKTVRLRGELSQGIALPVEQVLPPGDYFIGQDVSSIIGAEHYEKPIPTQMEGMVRCNFPGYVRKTDEPMLQSVPDVLDELKGVPVYSTIKCDGTSSSFIIKDQDYHICSRNLSFKLDSEENENNIYLRISKKYQIQEKLKELNQNIAIQGEICGPGIQKNRLGLKELDLFVFNIYDINKASYMSYDPFKSICHMFGLKTVPLLEEFELNHSLEELLLMAEGVYEGTKNRREGIVIRTVNEQYCKAINGRASFKVLNNKYLEKDES